MQRLVVAECATGYQTDVPAFLIKNDSFATLINAYIWRKRIRKKQGTETLGQLRRDLSTLTLGTTDGAGHFSGNLISIFFPTETDASIVLGSITIVVGAQTFTDDSLGALSNGSGGTGTINYASGAIAFQTNPALLTTSITIDFSYYTNLPVLGILDFLNNSLSTDPINFPDTIYMGQKYAYQFNYSERVFEDVSFYKDSGQPVIWTGQNYQQFFDENQQNCMFLTNNVPVNPFYTISAITKAANAQVTITAHGLNTGVAVWFNEVEGMSQINGLVGIVQSIVDVNNFTVDIDTTGFSTYTGGGIAIYLTQKSNTGDGLRWYDGFDPMGNTLGFVNFVPPLQGYIEGVVDNPTYLLGARIIIAYENRLFAIGTFESTSSSTTPTYYRDRIRASQVGTVFYNSLVPFSQGFVPAAWYDNTEGINGFFEDLNTNQRILTAVINQDTMLLGLEGSQLRITTTNNILDPIIIQTISPEFGSESTFAAIPLDQGVLSVGDYCFLFTTTYNAQRFDEIIPDQIYEIRTDSFGNERVCGIRDFRNEFIYFTYPQFDENPSDFVFPNRTLLFNYRDKNFAVFNEEYTSYGTFREKNGTRWEDLNDITWEEYNVTWNSGSQASSFPNIVGGNQQGFVLKKDQDTFNSPSHFIKNFSGNTITSPNHGRVSGDYILIEDCLGTIEQNGNIVQVNSVTDKDTFTIYGTVTGTYLGNGNFTVVDNFLIQTKEFPLGWQNGRKMRVGTTRYLLDTTSNGEFTVNLYTNENQATPVNDPLLSPWMPFGNVIRSRPDDSLGLNDAAEFQEQIWHRLSTSITGDTIQFGFTLSDEQIKNRAIASSQFTLHAIVADVYTESGVLA